MSDREIWDQLVEEVETNTELSWEEVVTQLEQRIERLNQKIADFESGLDETDGFNQFSLRKQIEEIQLRRDHWQHLYELASEKLPGQLREE